MDFNSCERLLELLRSTVRGFLCLIPESFRAPDLHGLHGKPRQCNSHLARLINCTWRGVLVVGSQVVNSPFWSLGWIWGSASMWTRCLPWCLGEKTCVGSDAAVCAAVPRVAGGSLPKGDIGLASPTCSPWPWGAELPCPLAGLQPSRSSASRGARAMACLKNFFYVCLYVLKICKPVFTWMLRWLQAGFAGRGDINTQLSRNSFHLYSNQNNTKWLLLFKCKAAVISWAVLLKSH